jgi:hypothetical protein
MRAAAGFVPHEVESSTAGTPSSDQKAVCWLFQCENDKPFDLEERSAVEALVRELYSEFMPSQFQRP